MRTNEGRMLFFPGLHHPSDARHFSRCMVSANALRGRQRSFPARDWILDSGAFTEITTHGRYRSPVSEYAQQAIRWSHVGNLLAAVSQDFMCEDFVLAKTGLTVFDHQRLTIERYDELAGLCRDGPYILPVLQGYWPDEYLEHLQMYGGRLHPGQWVGVGSVCKRNADVDATEQVLKAIHTARPDLRLHGFGLKITALESSVVRGCLFSADSMAWSDAARKTALPMLLALREELGRKVTPKEARAIYRSRSKMMPDPNDWREARRFAQRIEQQDVQQRQFQPRLF